MKKELPNTFCDSPEPLNVPASSSVLRALRDATYVKRDLNMQKVTNKRDL